MNKRIGYGIIGIIGVISLMLCGYHYSLKSNVKVLDKCPAMGENTVVLNIIESSGSDIVIEGYIEEPEPVLSADMEVCLNNGEDDIYYCIPTEFVEVCTEAEVANLNRTKAGFRARALWNKLVDNGKEWRIFILDRNNGKEKLIATDAIVTKEGEISND